MAGLGRGSWDFRARLEKYSNLAPFVAFYTAIATGEMGKVISELVEVLGGDAA